MQLLLHGHLSARPGQRDDLAAILLEASRLMTEAEGCRLYAVSIDEEDPNAVFVTEVWDAKADHTNALQLPAVRALIGKAMPLLDGQPSKGQSLRLLSEVGG